MQSIQRTFPLMDIPLAPKNHLWKHIVLQSEDGLYHSYCHYYHIINIVIIGEKLLPLNSI